LLLLFSTHSPPTRTSSLSLHDALPISEDYLAKLTASYNIPYIPDDYGNTFATAFLLQGSSFSVNGIIEQNTDVDMFRFNAGAGRSEEHTSELQSRSDLVCRLLLEKKNE